MYLWDYWNLTSKSFIANNEHEIKLAATALENDWVWTFSKVPNWKLAPLLLGTCKEFSSSAGACYEGKQSQAFSTSEETTNRWNWQRPFKILGNAPECQFHGLSDEWSFFPQHISCLNQQLKPATRQKKANGHSPWLSSQRVGLNTQMALEQMAKIFLEATARGLNATQKIKPATHGASSKHELCKLITFISIGSNWDPQIFLESYTEGHPGSTSSYVLTTILAGECNKWLGNWVKAISVFHEKRVLKF